MRPKRPARESLQGKLFLGSICAGIFLTALVGCKTKGDNILWKIPGEKPGVILPGTHSDPLLKENFVGADDGGSSAAVMLELARLLCSQRGKYAVWIAFFDGEEAMKQWSDTDSRYGSRQLAARLANTGEIKKIREFLL